MPNTSGTIATMSTIPTASHRFHPVVRLAPLAKAPRRSISPSKVHCPCSNFGKPVSRSVPMAARVPFGAVRVIWRAAGVAALVLWELAAAWLVLVAVSAEYGPIKLDPVEFCHEMHEREFYKRGEVVVARRSWLPPQTTCQMAGKPRRSWPENRWGGVASVGLAASIGAAPIVAVVMIRSRSTTMPEKEPTNAG